MKQSLSTAYFRLTTLLLLTLSVVVLPWRAEASLLQHFADNSVLAQGKWVRVEVTSTGMHLITTARLRSMGFTDPSRVGVYGYGGERISDLLSADKLVDDLPRVASVVTSRGIVFYANGPEGWRSATGRASAQMEHVINPYTETCYYYLTETDTPVEIPRDGIAGTADESTVATTFTERLYYETDRVSIVESGHDLYGEDFRYTPSRTFNFTLTDRVEGSNVWAQTRFMSNSSNSTSIVLSANGTDLPSDGSDRINATSGNYAYGDTCLSRKTFTINGERLNFGITHRSAGSLQNAYLDRIDINYSRRLSLPASGELIFSSTTPALCLDGVDNPATLHVWDVTDPIHVMEMNVQVSGRTVTWTGEYVGRRTYIAWNETASMREPGAFSTVANQNIHAMETPEMVIITVPSLLTQANAIADLHRNDVDSLKVLVVTADDVYNEFSSGMPDPGAFRRMLKMFYDRSCADRFGPQLQYCMLIGRPTYDHRRKAGMSGSSTEILPVWQTNISINDNYSYSSDDIIAMLETGSGLNQATGRLSIAIGRLPVSNVSAARIYVDKLTKYMTNPPTGDWVDQMLVIADDQDSGAHLDQAEAFISGLSTNPLGDQLLVNKVYLDAYKKTNGRVPVARSVMDKKLSEGVVWWQYIGHASHNSWTHEHLVTSAEVGEFYLSRQPVLFAATCDFGRWDSAETCGAEEMLLTDGGGVIAACTATRPVYIVQNGNFTRCLGRVLTQRNDDGSLRRYGEIVRRAKNMLISGTQSTSSSESNRLRYVIFGDPALPLTVPSRQVVVESINGVNLESPDYADNEPAVIMAHQQAVITGRVTDIDGKLIEDFNGTISLSIYDAESTTTTLGRGTTDNPGKVANFEHHGDLLYTGRAIVANGRFTVTAPMPSDITQNYRNGTMNIIAEAADGRRASGINRDFYVYGYDEGAAADTIAPEIEYVYLNHSSFDGKESVNDSPMVIASVSDNVGINLSSAGIGHQMTLRLDGNNSITDVSQYFTPAEDGSPAGTIAYPMSGLADGAHTLTLRVWDTSNNPAEASIEFFVDSSSMPKIFDVYTDTNPASTEARFYVEHNRPDARLTVTVEVFNLSGRLEWSSTTTGRSDMFVSTPVVWDLTDSSGRRVPRGIYLYRASLSADGGATMTSMSKRIAVTSR